MDGAALENFAEDDSWGEQPFGAPMPRAFRLVDAERIAAQRLDGAAEGSLKEALATVIVSPEPKGERLGERLQQVASATSPLSQLVATPEPASPPAIDVMPEVDFAWFGAAPPAHAVPCFEERDFTAPAFPSAEAAAIALPADLNVLSPSSAETPSDVATSPVLEAIADSTHPAATSDLFETVEAISDVAASAERDPEAPRPAPLTLPEDPSLEPLVTAYAASARLAADAAAASQALFELQKLLNEQKLEASPELNSAMEAHGLVGLDAIPTAQPPAPEAIETIETPPRPDPVTDANLAPPRIVQPLANRLAAAAPPPLPSSAAPAAVFTQRAEIAPPNAGPAAPVSHAQQRPQIRTAATRATQTPAASAAPKRPVRTKAQRPARRSSARTADALSGFDLRGFAAGFVLSGAIGVVLYFVMATG